MQLSLNFDSSEFKCPCKKCKDIEPKVSSLLIFKLEMLRTALGDKPIYISSGVRCEEYNKTVDGFVHSAHLTGEAADIKMVEFDPIEIGLVAEKLGDLRIGLADSYVHLDIQKPRPSKYWIYETNVIYSGSIENESLLRFYQIIKEGR